MGIGRVLGIIGLCLAMLIVCAVVVSEHWFRKPSPEQVAQIRDTYRLVDEAEVRLQKREETFSRIKIECDYYMKELDEQPDLANEVLAAADSMRKRAEEAANDGETTFWPRYRAAVTTMHLLPLPKEELAQLARRVDAIQRSKYMSYADSFGRSEASMSTGYLIGNVTIKTGRMLIQGH